MVINTYYPAHQEALEDLLQLFDVDDDRIRDPCIEYWGQLVSCILRIFLFFSFSPLCM